ncbi:hypothetical protein ACFLT1_02325 [Bacteroidota bacterium]
MASTKFTCIALLSASFLLPSCGDLFSPGVEYINLSHDDKIWLMSEEYGESFTMSDSTGSEIFGQKYEWTAYDISIRGDFLDKDETHYETRYQSFYSDRKNNFVIKIDARMSNPGASLIMNLNKSRFRYDILFDQLFSVSIETSAKGMHFKDGRYIDEDTMRSSAKYYDSFKIGAHTYSGVLQFTLKDFQDEWLDSTITEIVIGKEIGLLRYVMAKGDTMVRVMN